MSEIIRYLKAAIEVRDHFKRRNTQEEYDHHLFTMTSDTIEDVSGEKVSSVKIVRKLIDLFEQYSDDYRILFHSIYATIDNHPVNRIVEAMINTAAIVQEGFSVHHYHDEKEDEHFVIALRGNLLTILRNGVDDLATNFKIALSSI